MKKKTFIYYFFFYLEYLNFGSRILSHPFEYAPKFITFLQLVFYTGLSNWTDLSFLDAFLTVMMTYIVLNIIFFILREEFYKAYWTAIEDINKIGKKKVLIISSSIVIGIGVLSLSLLYFSVKIK